MGCPSKFVLIFLASETLAVGSSCMGMRKREKNHGIEGIHL
jgi:hypothetical protein